VALVILEVVLGPGLLSLQSGPWPLKIFKNHRRSLQELVENGNSWRPRDTDPPSSTVDAIGRCYLYKVHAGEIRDCAGVARRHFCGRISRRQLSNQHRCIACTHRSHIIRPPSVCVRRRGGSCLYFSAISSSFNVRRPMITGNFYRSYVFKLLQRLLNITAAPLSCGHVTVRAGVRRTRNFFVSKKAPLARSLRQQPSYGHQSRALSLPYCVYTGKHHNKCPRFWNSTYFWCL